MAVQSPYNNSDGLVIKFGTEESVSLHGGGTIAGHSSVGEQVTEVEINLDELADTVTHVMNYTTWIPHDALITRVRLVSLVSAAGSSAVLDVGLCYFATAGSNTLTDLNAKGLIADHLVTGMAVGEVHEFGLAGDSSINDAYLSSITTGGALIGTELASTASKYYISAEEGDSNAFTAGVVKVQVYWIPEGVVAGSTPTI